jgi:hypothetical protein
LTARLVDVDRGERRNVHEVAAARRRMEVMMNPAVTLYWLPLGACAVRQRRAGSERSGQVPTNRLRDPREIRAGEDWRIRSSDANPQVPSAVHYI